MSMEAVKNLLCTEIAIGVGSKLLPRTSNCFHCRKQRKLLKDKAKLVERKQLKMIHEGDPGIVDEDDELFALKKIRKVSILAHLVFVVVLLMVTGFSICFV